jgi:rhodanese-related sulfurtransferase
VSADLIFQFLGEQWILVAALATTLGMLILHETRKAGPALSISEAVQLVNNDEGVFLDIRDAGDYARGHITDALHIPAATLAKRAGELEKFREKPVVVVCKMGQSAGPATKTLRAQGFSRAQKLPIVTQ